MEIPILPERLYELDRKSTLELKKLNQEIEQADRDTIFSILTNLFKELECQIDFQITLPGTIQAVGYSDLPGSAESVLFDINLFHDLKEKVLYLEFHRIYGDAFCYWRIIRKVFHDYRIDNFEVQSLTELSYTENDKRTLEYCTHVLTHEDIRPILDMLNSDYGEVNYQAVLMLSKIAYNIQTSITNLNFIAETPMIESLCSILKQEKHCIRTRTATATCLKHLTHCYIPNSYFNIISPVINLVLSTTDDSYLNLHLKRECRSIWENLLKHDVGPVHTIYIPKD